MKNLQGITSSGHNSTVQRGLFHIFHYSKPNFMSFNNLIRCFLCLIHKKNLKHFWSNNFVSPEYRIYLLTCFSEEMRSYSLHHCVGDHRWYILTCYAAVGAFKPWHLWPLLMLNTCHFQHLKGPWTGYSFPALAGIWIPLLWLCLPSLVEMLNSIHCQISAGRYCRSHTKYYFKKMLFFQKENKMKK